MSKELFVIILAGVLVLSVGINKPFVGIHDFNSAQFGNAAKNYLRYGALNLKFGQVTGHIHGDYKNNKSVYTSYLPTLSLLIALSFSIFGQYEWAERLIPISFSIIGLISLFLITKKLWGGKIAILTSVFFIFNPMFIYFGKMPTPDTLTLAVMLLSFYRYLVWLDTNRTRDLVILCLALFSGGTIAWIILYFGPLMILHSFLVRQFSAKLLIPLVVLFATFLLQILHQFILTGSIFGAAFITLKNRLSEPNLSFGGQDYSLLNYLKREISILQAYFTRTLIILSLVSTAWFLTRLKANIQTATLIFLLLFALGHPVIFSRAVFIHEYHNIYMLPFLSVTGALGIELILKKLKEFGVKKIILDLSLITILLVFITERIDFSKALLGTSMNQDGLFMGQLLNSLQKKADEAVVISPRFNSFYGVFTDFYSKYPYSVTDEEELKMNDNLYKYIITIDEDILDVKYYKDLTERGRFQRIGDWTVIINE